MAKHTHGSHTSKPRRIKNKLTLIGLHVAPFAALRNPTVAFFKRGGLTPKTRKPA